MVYTASSLVVREAPLRQCHDTSEGGGFYVAVGRMVQRTLRLGVDTTLLTVKGDKSYTGRCVCLVDQKGQRTMLPALEDAIRLQPDEISADSLKGVKWVIVNGYSYYGGGLVRKLCVSFDP